MAGRKRLSDLTVNVMLLNKSRARAIAVVTGMHAVVSVVSWVWMAGVTGLGFKDKGSWSAFDHLQATVVPFVAQAITLPGRMLWSIVDTELGMLAVLIVNSALWAVVLVGLYSVLRGRHEQHDS